MVATMAADSEKFQSSLMAIPSQRSKRFLLRQHECKSAQKLSSPASGFKLANNAQAAQREGMGGDPDWPWTENCGKGSATLSIG